MTGISVDYTDTHSAVGQYTHVYANELCETISALPFGSSALKGSLMHTPATRETQRLSEQKHTVGLSLDTPHRTFKIVYQRRLTTRRQHHRPNVGFGLVIGALLMLSTLGYGMPTLGGLVLAVLVVLAVWNAGRDE